MSTLEVPSSSSKDIPPPTVVLSPTITLPSNDKGVISTTSSSNVPKQINISYSDEVINKIEKSTLTLSQEEADISREGDINSRPRVLEDTRPLSTEEEGDIHTRQRIPQQEGKITLPRDTDTSIRSTLLSTQVSILSQNISQEADYYTRPRIAPRILEEDDYINGLEYIIERDYYPDLNRLRVIKSYIDARTSGDYNKANIINQKLILMTPASVRGDSVRGGSVRGGSVRGDSVRDPSNHFISDNIRHSGDISNIQSTDNNNNYVTLVDGRKVLFNKKMSLDRFHSLYTSEDNSSFDSIIRKEYEKRRHRDSWMHTSEREHNDRQIVSIAAIDRGDKPLQILSSNHKARNSLLFIPEGQINQPHSRTDIHKNIHYTSCRFTTKQIQLNKLQEESKRIGEINKDILLHHERQHERVVIDGTLPDSTHTHTLTNNIINNNDNPYNITNDEREAILNKLQGREGMGPIGKLDHNYMTTPVINPDHPGMTPLMTWGHVGSTPLLLGTSVDSIDNSLLQPKFEIVDRDERSEAALRLAEKAGRNLKKKRQTRTDTLKAALTPHTHTDTLSTSVFGSIRTHTHTYTHTNKRPTSTRPVDPREAALQEKRILRIMQQSAKCKPK
eukprot:GHVR01128078.1.p1 GENE.GHVR01128078.1~~GHVR01128078.1.p1  ORF type:complete len:617 (+),score=190.35 GHVR01128078.1:26-1876(+)